MERRDEWIRTDYDAMSAVYDKGRAMPAEWVDEWRTAVTPYLEGLDAPVADIGAGAGIWSAFIASWFAQQVVAIEPSSGMRRRAVENRRESGISYVAGEAEHLPLRDRSCAAAWMSTVVHHFRDLPTAAREARRVVRDGGSVLMRQGFSGRHDDILWTQAFPSALAIAERRHPSIDAVVGTFEAAGFRHERTQRVSEIAAANLDEYVKKIETRADSTLTLIDDDEFEDGLRQLRTMAENAPAEPVTATLDLVVFR